MDYLEKYILVDNKEKKIIYINRDMFDDFSLSELGYRFSKYFNFKDMFFLADSISSNEEETVIDVYDDFVLFDLIESLILFSRKEKRSDVIIRINSILTEELSEYYIKESLINKNNGDDLKNIANQLKDEKLGQKIFRFFDYLESEDFVNSSKISAEILNILVSDSKNGKPKTIKKIKGDIANSIVSNTKDIETRKEELKSKIETLLRQANDWSNSIYDVRHSEKDRIKVSNDYVYKLVSLNNIGLIELIITSLKDQYIITDDWESQKTMYIEKYKINKLPRTKVTGYLLLRDTTTRTDSFVTDRLVRTL